MAKLRNLMSNHVGVTRDHDGLVGALAGLESMAATVPRRSQFTNMVTAARLITLAALNRTESRGGHFRADFPESDPDLARRSFLRETDIPNSVATIDAALDTHVIQLCQ